MTSNRKNLLLAVAPLALSVVATVPTGANAAETRANSLVRAIPPPGITRKPPKVDETVPVRTVIVDPAEEQKAQEEKKDAPATTMRVREPRIQATVPNDVSSEPRIRTRVPAPADDEGVRVDAAEAAPSTGKRVRIDRVPRIDETVPVEVENAPRVRTRVPKPAEESSPEEAAPPRTRTRVTPPSADTSAPPEIENRPRVRIRTATPAEDPAESAPPSRHRIGTPDVGSTPVEVPVGPIGSVNSAQADCLFRRAKNLTPDPRTDYRHGPGPGIMEMVCVTKGKPELVAFRYDTAMTGNGSNAFRAAAKFDEQGFGSRISYALERREEGSSSRPIYQLVSIEKGENYRTSTTCIDPSNVLGRAKQEINGDNPGKPSNHWCSDGKTISQLSLQVNNWLSTTLVDLTVSIKADGELPPASKAPPTHIQNLSFEASTGVTDSGPFLVRELFGTSANAVTCKIVSNTVGSLYCASDTVNGTVTTYLAYSLPELRKNIGALPQPICTSETKPVFDENTWAYGDAWGNLTKFVRYYDYKVTTCDTPRIAYYLLPGTLRSADRGQFNGACYLASNAFITIEKKVTVTYSRAVEATDTGDDAFIPNVSDPDRSPRVDVIVEGKTISVNGSLDPDRKVMADGRYAPKPKISNVNAPCS